MFSVFDESLYSPPSARGGRGAVGLLNGVFIHPPVRGSQPGRRSGLKAGSRSAGQQAGGRAGGVRIEGRGRGGEKGRERREEVVGKKEHQELGRALDRLHTGRVQTNNRRLRRRHR